MTSIEFIKIIYHIFVNRSIVIIIFVYLLVSGRLITKLIEISRYLHIGISNGRNTLYFFYIKSLPTDIYLVYLNISSYVVVYPRLIIGLLNNLINLYAVRVFSYDRIVYKFEYFKF